MFMSHFVFLFDFLGLVNSFCSPLVWLENTEKGHIHCIDYTSRVCFNS